MYNLDITEPVDMKSATVSLGNNNKLFYDLLERLEEMSITTCMTQLANALKFEDWHRMK